MRVPPSGGTWQAVHASHTTPFTTPLERPKRAPRAPISASTRADPMLAENAAGDRPDRPGARPSTTREDAVAAARPRRPQTARCPRLPSSCDRRARTRHVSQRGAAKHAGGLQTPSATAPRRTQLPTPPQARDPWSGSAQEAVYTSHAGALAGPPSAPSSTQPTTARADVLPAGAAARDRPNGWGAHLTSAGDDAGAVARSSQSQTAPSPRLPSS
jgi:hypothetical protein